MRERPYASLAHEMQVCIEIYRRKLPDLSVESTWRIRTPSDNWRLELLKDLCRRCWSFKPGDRPSMAQTIKDLNMRADGNVERPYNHRTQSDSQEEETSYSIKVSDLMKWSNQYQSDTFDR